MVKVDLTGVKIPKTVGGVKLPKKLRKQGKKLIAKANSPAGREAIAAGLTIAGTVLAARASAKAGRAAAGAGAGKPAKAPARPGEPGIDQAIDPAHQLGDAIAAGIGALQRFLANGRP